jgi:hypothetical protein
LALLALLRYPFRPSLAGFSLPAAVGVIGATASAASARTIQIL